MVPRFIGPVVQTAHWISSITMMMRKQRKDRTYSEFSDAAVFTKLDVKEDGGNLVVTANYKLGNLDKAQWTINPSGELALDYTYNFSGVVDLMGIRFDYPGRSGNQQTLAGCRTLPCMAKPYSRNTIRCMGKRL